MLRLCLIFSDGIWPYVLRVVIEKRQERTKKIAWRYRSNMFSVWMYKGSVGASWFDPPPPPSSRLKKRVSLRAPGDSSSLKPSVYSGPLCLFLRSRSNSSHSGPNLWRASNWAVPGVHQLPAVLFQPTCSRSAYCTNLPIYLAKFPRAVRFSLLLFAPVSHATLSPLQRLLSAVLKGFS